MGNFMKGLSQKIKLNFKTKLMIFVASLVAVALVILGYAVITIEQNGISDHSNDSITLNTLKLQASQITQAFKETQQLTSSYSNQIYSSYDNNIKQQVQSGISVINHYYGLYTKGVLTEEDAKKQAKDALRNITYGTNGYFFMDNTNYILQVLPTAPEKEGMNRKDLADPNGVYYARTWVDGVQKDPNGEVFVDYSFTKPGQPQDKYFPKRSFCKLFKPWGWVLGTGNYIDDLQNEVSKYVNTLNDNLQTKIDEISGHGSVTIIDATGKVIFRTNKELAGQTLNIQSNDENILNKILKIKNEMTLDYTDTKDSVHKLHIRYISELQKYVVIDRDSSDIYEGSTGSILILILIIISLSLLASYFLANSITKPIFKIKDAVQKLSKGDFTISIDIDSQDEIGELAQSFNTMINNQKEVLNKVLDASQNVSSASEQISGTTEEMNSTTQNQTNVIEEFAKTVENVNDGIQDISNNITQLASNVSNVSTAISEMNNSIQDTTKHVENTSTSISEVTVSIEQMGTSIQSIGENSKEVQIEAQKTVSKAKEGNTAVNNTINEMDKISKAVVELSSAVKDLGKSAEKIGDIVEVIDDIADQTNLLSLNAAIEAARAGDAGKGFAVVSNSIRNLAERSSEATKDISKLIRGIQNEVNNAVVLTNDSTDRVKEGVQFVKSTEKVFEEIFNAISNTSTLIQQIGAAIHQQEASSKEISNTMSKMNEMVIQLSATTEQQSAGADEIVKSVSRMNAVMQNVSATTEVQAAGSQEMVKLISGIRKGTQEVAAGSEEIAASTQHLAHQSQDLMHIVENFKTK